MTISWTGFAKLFYAFNFAAATLAGRLLLNREDAIATVYGSVMRNLSIALGISDLAI
ncbi:MAG TPA: hypothetical protein VFE20_00700 [Thermoleophilia bacterium]|nr:hypothetical protein [Thermoleophilia bacterium]